MNNTVSTEVYLKHFPGFSFIKKDHVKKLWTKTGKSEQKHEFMELQYQIEIIRIVKSMLGIVKGSLNLCFLII